MVALASCYLLAVAADYAVAQLKIFDPLGDTHVERIDKFVAADAFKIGSKTGGKSISTVGWNFAAHFLGVVEVGVPAGNISGWALQFATSDKSLIAAFGGERNVEMAFLAYVHRAMQTGASYTDGQSNLAYLRSPIDRRLWAIHWTVNHANAWDIGAVEVPHPHLDWRYGSRLFTAKVHHFKS